MGPHDVLAVLTLSMGVAGLGRVYRQVGPPPCQELSLVPPSKVTQRTKGRAGTLLLPGQT